MAENDTDIQVFIAVYGNTNPGYITNFFNNSKEKIMKNLTTEGIQAQIDPVVFQEEKKFRTKHSLGATPKELDDINSVRVTSSEQN